MLAAGVAVGVAMMASPVSGHVGNSVTHLWNAHLKSKTDARYYTKAQANARYLPATARLRIPSSWTGSTRPRFLRSDAAAGGDLTGTFPAPAIAAGVVTTAKLAFDPATQAELDATLSGCAAADGERVHHDRQRRRRRPVHVGDDRARMGSA